MDSSYPFVQRVQHTTICTNTAHFVSGTVNFTVFTDVLQVLEVYNGTNGLLGVGSRLGPWLYIDSSTVDPQTSRKISAAISRCHLKENKGLSSTTIIFSHSLLIDTLSVKHFNSPA